MTNSGEHCSKRKVLPPDERREMILDAALDVFSKGGFQDADVDEIARLAQVGKGTVYRYYASKRELYLAVVERVFSHLQARLEAVQGQSLSPSQILCTGVAEHVRFFTENPRCWRVLVVGRLENRLNPCQNTMLAHHALKENLTTLIREGIASGDFREVDPEYAAFALMSMAATVVEKHFHQDKDTLQEDINSALDIYLRGIGK
ncbi:MAG: TetR/AcrR family transcriptional regulator [Candidatus Zixiibacteriota bacterium]|nr:MAG: TetR/AcrR family transcriptional regulator [candidate division Zixibacteria bacterium]